MDYWESGMDLGLARNHFDSFMKYQGMLANEFKHMAQKYNFQIINGNRSIRWVSQQLESNLHSVLDIG